MPDLRQLTHVIYALFALGVLTGGMLGIATIAAVVIIYIKRSDAAGTLYAAHYDWLLRTFWWGLLWAALGMLLTAVYIGFIVLAINVVWVVYRIARGWLGLFDGRAPTHFA
ncbi:MAG: hypothetical protein JHC61_06495 [Burkholderiaceae bacterium]|nr:hypothetical protein [Burkholderiaceae bacterium]